MNNSAFYFIRNVPLLFQTALHLNSFKKNLSAEAAAYMHPFLYKAKASNDGTLTKGILYKLKDYPFEGLVAGQLIAEMIGHKTSQKERKNLSLAGAVLALGDVFCDDTGIEESHILQMLNSPGSAECNNTIEKLFTEIYSGLLNNLDEEERHIFHKAILEGFEAERRSRLLTNNNLTDADILKIIEDKGGVSLIIYRSLLSPPTKQGETEALYALGALIQFIDDVFDLKWDYEKGINTSATIHQSWDGLYEQLYNQYIHANELLKNYERRNRINRFRFTFFLFTMGVKAYITKMKRITGNRFTADTLIRLNEQDTKFNYVSFENFNIIFRNLHLFK